MSPAKRSRIQIGLAVVILLVVAGWHGWWVTRGWNIPGLSGHEFRQTQTAISIQAMQQDGFRMDYSTPIFGKPWSIPFEFPVYQGIVYVVSNVTGLNVVQAGRWVSLCAFYLAMPAFVLLMRRAGFSPIAAVLATVPVLFAPVYLLYSRAVMIESTALCTGAWFLVLLLAYRARKTPLLLAATLVMGTIAVLTKATTWAVFCLPWAGCVLSDLWRARREGWRALRVLVDDAFLIGAPLLVIGFGWVWITDRIKEMNPIGSFLTSANLTAFNFGTAAQHVDPAVWKQLWIHWNEAVMPGWALIAGLVAACFVPARQRGTVVLGAFAFLVGQFVFINLYAIHNYYFYANAWAACLGVGAVAGAFWDSARRWYAGALPAVVLLVVVCAGAFVHYRGDFYTIQVSPNDGTLGLTEAIKRLTKPKDVIVVQSPDWSSILAYRSGRRMLMIPDSQMFFHPDEVERSIGMLHDENVPLVIFRDQSRVHVDWLLQRIRDFHLEWVPLFTWTDDAVVYARRDLFPPMRKILEQEHFSGVTLDASRKPLDLKPAEPIAGTPAAAGLSMLDPVPLSGSLPYGVSIRQADGKPYFFAHPPTELNFSIPPHATHIDLGYRMHPEAYGKKDFDGAFVMIDLKLPDGTTRTLFEDWLTPDGSRKSRHATVSLEGQTTGTLVFRTLAGPANNLAYDWVLLEYFRIR